MCKFTPTKINPKQLEAMKRTKTPHQISDQCKRLMHQTALNHWDGKQYHDHAGMMAKLDAIKTTAWRYIDSIYLANGMNRHDQHTQTDKSNFVWDNAATQREIYAK